uniref:Bromodomain-containing protein 7 n=2 Tax=Lygus hesperus TaxID=30085 RepID=A0A0A9Y975_LYGHE
METQTSEEELLALGESSAQVSSSIQTPTPTTSPPLIIAQQQPQQGMTVTPKLQQIISAAVQKPQMVAGSSKLQQIIVAGTQGGAPSSKLQQIISAAIQQQPGTAGSPQIQRIVTSTPQAMASQLQQMITASSQAQGSPRLQQIVVTTSQLQQIVNNSAQLQQNITASPQQHRIVTTSTPLLQGVIASTQAQQGLKSGTLVTQGMKTTPQLIKAAPNIQMQHVVKTNIPSSQMQPTIIKTTGVTSSPQMQQVVKQVSAQLQQSASSQIQQGIRSPPPSTPQQVIKSASSPHLQQVIKSSGSQQTFKSSAATMIQQGVKQTSSPQLQQVIKTSQTGVTASPQLQQSGKSSIQQTVSPQVHQTVKQGVSATPRLLQMVASNQKKTTGASPSITKEHVEKSKPPKPPKPTNLGELIGKLSQGSRHVKRFKEDRRNIAKAVKPLSYGAFGSYAPSYDSSFANLSKDESDLLNGSYTEFEPSAQIKSIISKDSDYTFTLADSLIDILGGGSSKRIKLEKEELPDEKMEDDSFLESKDGIIPKTEEDELQTLSSLGIDLSHLESFDDGLSKDAEGSPEIQQKLEYTTSLLKRLQQMQYDRLSVPPHPRLGHTILPPSDSEVNLATEITGNLTELAKQVPPGALVVDRVCTLK